MQARIRELESSHDYKEALKSSCKANGISCKLLNGLTLRKMEKIYKRTLTHYENSPERAPITWFENQLRLFQWALVIESALLALPLNLFKQAEWIRIQDYFFPKPIIMLEFECRRLLSRAEAQFHIVWCEEESLILQGILEDKTLFGRWNEVSRGLYELSGKRFYRSGKQCREQWLNHLDNSKKHGEWQEEQDVAILRQVLLRGHRWAQICKACLPHRTEHMVKNRFKSLLIRYERPKEKWNLHERRSIKRTLAKLLPVKDSNLQNDQEIPKGKNSSNILGESGQSESMGGGSDAQVGNLPSDNLLSVDNKYSEGGQVQEWRVQHNVPCWPHHYPQYPHHAPASNGLSTHSWEANTFPSQLFEQNITEVAWSTFPGNYACYMLAPWQPFGYMI